MRNRIASRGGSWPMALLLAGALSGPGGPIPARASDHDDGESNIKSRNRNLTDLFVFREDWQTGNGGDNGNMILIMCTNPRSLPRQQYFFDHTARYEFHLTRIDRDTTPTGVPNMTLRFTFGSPDAAGQQAITVTRINYTNGVPTSEVSATGGLTTAAAPGLGTPTPVSNTVSLDGATLTVYAGLREDPFFFDVEAFFRVRAFLRSEGPSAGFAATLDDSLDFAKGYNVNAIVVRVPLSFLQQGTTNTVFDFWETISVPQ